MTKSYRRCGRNPRRRCARPRKSWPNSPATWRSIRRHRSSSHLVSITMILIVLLMMLVLSACGHPKQARVDVPPPPPPSAESTSPTTRPEATNPPTKTVPSAKESGADADLAEPEIPADTKPLATETGLASWYGPPYHNRRGSNGEVYNMHAMTAAHRTYPLGSVVRVTNLKTGRSALVRITDRGPFIPGRILDLSLAAAQKLSDHLSRRYRTAKVQCFASPAGDWWIRIRVLDDDHERAKKLAAETETPEGAVFVVRLD